MLLKQSSFCEIVLIKLIPYSCVFVKSNRYYLACTILLISLTTSLADAFYSWKEAFSNSTCLSRIMFLRWGPFLVLSVLFLAILSSYLYIYIRFRLNFYAIRAPGSCGSGPCVRVTMDDDGLTERRYVGPGGVRHWRRSLLRVITENKHHLSKLHLLNCDSTSNVVN